VAKKVPKKATRVNLFRFESFAPHAAKLSSSGKCRTMAAGIEVAQESKSEKFDGRGCKESAIINYDLVYYSVTDSECYETEG